MGIEHNPAGKSHGGKVALRNPERKSRGGGLPSEIFRPGLAGGLSPPSPRKKISEGRAAL
jgi:hypothetical protein